MEVVRLYAPNNWISYRCHEMNWRFDREYSRVSDAGQRGTIPEQMEPRDAVSQREMVVSSDDIRRAQEALKAKGRDPGAISGRMHAKTQEALREFQKANDLPATGVLDKKTADKLGITLKGDEDSTPQKREDGTKRESRDSTKREQQ